MTGRPNISRLRQSVLVAASISLLTAPATVAQTDTAMEERADLVCLAIGHRWNGSAADRARIDAVPVPQSFQGIFHAGGCARFQLLLDSLVTWHMRYGSARSALAAGRFFEQEMGVRVAPGFEQDFERAWQATLMRTQSLLERERARNPGRSDERILRSLEPQMMEIAQRSGLAEYRNRLEGLRFVAGEYTRAAEYFLDRDLLQAARRLHEPEYRSTIFLDEQAAKGPVELVLAERIRPQFRTDRMTPQLRELTLAVVEAEIARDVESIEAADAITRRHYRPDGKSLPYSDLLTFSLMAYEEDDEACRADERNSLAGYKDRCEENGFEAYALGFWYQRSRLELLARELAIPLEPLDRPFSRDGSASRTIDLFLRRAWQQGMRYGEAPAPPEAVWLLVRSGEATAHLAVTSCDPQSQDFRRALTMSLDTLSRALQLADPVEQPWLYRPMAQAYQHTYEQFTACGADIPEDRFRRAYAVSKAYLDIAPALDIPE
ncbi:MAG: hypothetical protein R3E04_12160 [Sphingobium sp.]